MWTRVQHWLTDIPLVDALEYRQATVIQMGLIGMVIVDVLLLPLFFVLDIGQAAQRIAVVAGILFLATTVIALVILRRGAFKMGVMLSMLGMLLALAGFMIATGLRGPGSNYLAMAIPIVIVGLLVGRREMLIISGLCMAIVLTIPILERRQPPLAGFASITGDITAMILMGTVLFVVVLSFLTDRFRNALRDALDATQTREHELERIRAAQESVIAERTASLQTALRTVEEREARLARTLADLQESQVVVRELSAPIIPVLPGVLVAPLIGALDDARASVFAENVLTAIERKRTDHVILDITGVPVVDTHVAQLLLQTASAARLLGARVLLVGIRPEVAQTLVALGVVLTTIKTYADLQEAIEALLVPYQSRSELSTDPL